MKESFEDKMNNRFKETLENFQVEYDPHAWERLQKELSFKRASYWRNWKILAGLIVGIIAVCVIVYWGYLPGIKSLIINQSVQNQVSTAIKETNPQLGAKTEKALSLSIEKLDMITRSEKKAEKVIPEPTISLSDEPGIVAVGSENGNLANPFIEKVTEKSGPISEAKIELKLMPITKRTIAASEGKRQKLNLRLPKLNLDLSDNGYSRFVGPNKLSVFYNPEFQMEKTLKNPGVAHGLGFELEGPINSKINLALGINYFSKSYTNTEIFRLDSSKVSGLHVPFVDSTINRSGNYQFLEMPVTIRLNLYSGQRSSLFFDCGFSAIAFLNQQYNTQTIVNQVETGDTIKSKAWKNIHPFASLNFGLTYRYALSERLSLCASVVYKNHLTGLGALPMELNRFTGKIGIVYRFGRNDMK
jgi:hypothetical protein